MPTIKKTRADAKGAERERGRRVGKRRTRRCVFFGGLPPDGELVDTAGSESKKKKEKTGGGISSVLK